MTDIFEVESGSDNLRVYEVGYLLLPSIPEEKVPDEVSIIKEHIARLGGVILSQEEPRMRTLAYEMVKPVGTRNERFKSAYFGWVKFESMPDGAVELKKVFDLSPSVLRFILIKTVREDTVSYAKREEEAQAQEAERLAAVESAGVASSGEELDKSIDELVAE